MNKIPEIKKLSESSSIWNQVFNTFEATVYVPEPNSELKSDILNYGFLAPYTLIFAETKMTNEEAISFAREKGFEKLASDFASSLVFIYPTTGDWNTASPEILSEIISNSKIHQYYKDGYITDYNRFTKNVNGYFIRGAIFRTNLYGFGKSADYIAKNCLKHFEGDGLWGRSDLAPAACIFTGLSTTPDIQEKDIPVVYYGDDQEKVEAFKKGCNHFISKSKPDYINDYYSFIKQFRRMNGPLQIDSDLEKNDLIREPGVAIVNTSEDNNGDDKGTKQHKIGYFAFYNKGLLDNGPVPLVLGFHGGGDSCFFFSIMAGWANICNKNNFLLVTVENHLNSTATEMIEFIEQLKKIYPIDEKRIYATGFSMGGIKTWDLIQEYPELLAAAAPMDATVDIGENVYFQKINKEVNKSVSVPVFYAAGEVTPLDELPFQAQKCVNRMKYILELNNAEKVYDVKLENKEIWENKLWGINGDSYEEDFDPSRNATLKMQKFKNKKGQITTIFASITDQGHDCRQHTCEHAWQFMKQFSQD